MKTKIKSAIVFLLLIGALLFLGSCSQQKKLQKAKNALRDNPSELAQLCIEQFPASETIVYLPGEVVTDTMYTPMEILIPVDCPPSEEGVVIQWKTRVVTKTIENTRVDTIKSEVEHGPTIAALQIDLSTSEMEKKKAQTKYEEAKKYKTWFWLLVIIISVSVMGWAYYRIRMGALNSFIKKIKP